jgi:hypothetical protein
MMLIRRLSRPAGAAGMSLFIFCVSIFSQTSPEALLRRGVGQYENAQFETAILTLQLAEQEGLKQSEDLITTLKYKAYSYSALGDSASAKQVLFRLLEKYPVYDVLFSDSPKMRPALTAVLKKDERVDSSGVRQTEGRTSKSGLATVYVQTSPWAVVYLDGRRVDWTPVTLYDVVPGVHEIGFEPDRQGLPERILKTVRVEKGEHLRISEMLE